MDKRTSGPAWYWLLPYAGALHVSGPGLPEGFYEEIHRGFPTLCKENYHRDRGGHRAFRPQAYTTQKGFQSLDYPNSYLNYPLLDILRRIT